MSRFTLNMEQLKQFLKTHPHMADLPIGNAHPESVAGNHKSVVLYRGIRTYCWRTREECEQFMKAYGATRRRNP